jgi:hypothetical protein
VSSAVQHNYFIAHVGTFNEGDMLPFFQDYPNNLFVTASWAQSFVPKYGFKFGVMSRFQETLSSLISIGGH